MASKIILFQMIVKIAYQDQIHLFRGEVGIITLKQHCQKVFRCLPSSFDFFYTDEEGDRITMSTDYDIDAFKYLHGGKGVTKLYIHECIESSIPASHDNSLLFIDVNHPKQDRVQNQKFCFTQQEFEQVIKEQVSESLQRMSEATAEKLVEEENKMYKQEVRTYLEKIALECAEKMINQHPPAINTQTTDELVGHLVEEKIKSMMDQLVEDISVRVSEKIWRKHAELWTTQLK